MVDRLMELRMAADRVEEALIDLRAAVRLFDQPILSDSERSDIDVRLSCSEHPYQQRNM